MLKDGGTSTVTEADVGIALSNRELEKYCKNTELGLKIALTLLLLDFSTRTSYFGRRAVRAPERILVSVSVRFSAHPYAHVDTNL